MLLTIEHSMKGRVIIGQLKSNQQHNTRTLFLKRIIQWIKKMVLTIERPIIYTRIIQEIKKMVLSKERLIIYSRIIQEIKKMVLSKERLIIYSRIIQEIKKMVLTIERPIIYGRIIQEIKKMVLSKERLIIYSRIIQEIKKMVLTIERPIIYSRIIQEIKKMVLTIERPIIYSRNKENGFEKKKTTLFKIFFSINVNSALKLVYIKNCFDLTKIFVLRLFKMAAIKPHCSRVEQRSVIKYLVSEMCKLCGIYRNICDVFRGNIFSPKIFG